jgi:tetratricopeptide (TPR) repeat protein
MESMLSTLPFQEPEGLPASSVPPETSTSAAEGLPSGAAAAVSAAAERVNPDKGEKERYPGPSPSQAAGQSDGSERLPEDFLLAGGFSPGMHEHVKQELRRAVAEAEELVRQNRWQDILDLFYPLEDKAPALVETGMDYQLRLKVAFALGQSGRFEEALKALEPALKLHPQDFHVQSAAGFNAYQSLLKRRERKVSLIPEGKRERIQQAHEHFRRCQELRPDHVTSFYREGMLFKEVEGKTFKAAACFRQAIRNWETLSEEDRKRRHQERPKYIRSLYHLASCLLEDANPQRAFELLERCVREDHGDVLSPVHKHFAMAKVLHAMGRYREALEYLETAGHSAREGEPTDYIWELAARCCLYQGNAQEGMRYLQRVPERIRRHYVRWTEADLLVALGRDNEAERVLVRSAERDRRSRHKALLRLAHLHYRCGKPERALEEAEQANRFYRETFGNECQDALFWIAGCLHRLGRTDAAEQTISALEGLNPEYPNLIRMKERIRGGPEHG